MKFHIVTMPGAQYAWNFHRRRRPSALCAQNQLMAYRVRASAGGNTQDRVVHAEDLAAAVGGIYETWPQATVSITPSMDEPTSSGSSASTAKVISLYPDADAKVVAEAA